MTRLFYPHFEDFWTQQISVIKRDHFIQSNVEINKKDAIKNLKGLEGLLKGK